MRWRWQGQGQGGSAGRDERGLVGSFKAVSLEPEAKALLEGR